MSVLGSCFGDCLTSFIEGSEGTEFLTVSCLSSRRKVLYRVDHFLLLGQARNDPPPICVRFEGSTTIHHVHNTVMGHRQKHFRFGSEALGSWPNR